MDNPALALTPTPHLGQGGPRLRNPQVIMLKSQQQALLRSLLFLWLKIWDRLEDTS